MKNTVALMLSKTQSIIRCPAFGAEKADQSNEELTQVEGKVKRIGLKAPLTGNDHG